MAELPGVAASMAMLGSVPLFAPLTKRQLKTLVESGKERTFRAGDAIVHQGDKVIGFFLIQSGEARVERGGTAVASLGPGQYFGEMALLDDQPRTADVKAVGPVQCLVLSSWEFWSAVGDEPEVLRTLFKETVRRLRSGATGLSE
ncbi:MAG: cyclic nucleotide-binding domain-containing protein [Thermoplasmata archaeon]|nr:cyclic nucleotide-binding domain-containing protein [Thermoplasmata archaeon]